MKKLKLLILSLIIIGSLGANSSAHATTIPSKRNVSISIKTAISIFQSEYPDTDITSVELDRSFGKYFYEIEGRNDSVEYIAKIDAKSKKISENEKDRLDADDRDVDQRAADKLEIEDIISVSKASGIAKKEVGAGKVTDWKLDKELNTTYWEVKVKSKSKTTEVMIDAKSGEVLSTEVDD